MPPPPAHGEPRDEHSNTSGAVSHQRPLQEGGAIAPPAPPISLSQPAVSLSQPPVSLSQPPVRSTPPPSLSTLPPPSSTLIARPMTMPPIEAPPEADDLDESALSALRPTRPIRIESERPPPPQDGEVRVRGVPARTLPEASLTGHAGLFMRAKSRNLLERPAEYYEWYQTRSRAGLWPYSRRFEGPIGPLARTRAEDGMLIEGLNFAAHDYLSLSAHPAVHEAAHRAIRDYGTIAGGSPILAGNTPLSRQLEEEVSKLVGANHVLLFTSGWTAAFGVITALVREHDHIVMDVYSHASLQQGAAAATRKISRFRHCDNASAERQIRKARNADPEGGILVVTETLFSMDSDSPRIAELQDICHSYGATLLVDCAHDLGALGPGGSGRLGIEGMIGKVDLLVGCFSKAFATNGGFVATHDESVRQYLRAFGGPHLFSTGLSPVQTAVALAALRISASAEGDELRRRMMEASRALRDELAARDLETLGEPSALVPVMVGEEDVSRIAVALCFERGLSCNLVEYPAVAVAMSRFRLQVQPLHTREQVRAAARIVDESIQAALHSGVRKPAPAAD